MFHVETLSLHCRSLVFQRVAEERPRLLVIDGSRGFYI